MAIIFNRLPMLRLLQIINMKRRVVSELFLYALRERILVRRGSVGTVSFSAA
jgi:hypothetical protein